MTTNNGKTSPFRSKLLSGPDVKGVVHAFLGRYEDQKELDEMITEEFNVDSESVVTIDQVHGSSVMLLEKPLKESSFYRKQEGDAIVTALFGVPIAIRSADCMPILFYDNKTFTIGVAHAGWRSTLDRVAIKTIEAMQKEFGSNPEDIKAAFGPSIGPCCYYVEPQMVKKFAKEGLNINSFIISDNSTRLDLGLANTNQLIGAGLKIENISSKAPCTYHNNKLYYSFRAEGDKASRQLSILMMKGSR
ncbi:MAG: peptidoglycan editing factor PgeF [Thermodesulfobacteriota bacterium]